MPLKSILVLVDFGPADAAALQRAGQLAAAHRATLRLLHAPPGSLPPPKDVTRRLTSAGRQLQERTGVRVKTVPAPARTLSQVAAEAKWSDLVVVADCHERSVAAFFFGQPVQRLLRRCICPVLVVRSTATGPYERVLLRNDGPAAGVTARVAARVAPRAVVVLLESMPPSLRDGEVATVGWTGQIGTQQQSGADLVAIGTRRRPTWQEWLAPSVPARAWRDPAGDLLLVPEDYARAGRSAAARRLLRDQERCNSAVPLACKRSS